MTKRAVVVGINDYSGIGSSRKSNLSSCVPDADSMTESLVGASGFDSSFNSIYGCHADYLVNT